MRCVRFLCALLLVIAAIAEARAVPPLGVLEGVARDALQRPLGGVHLRLEAPDGRVVASAISGSDGAYRFTGIAPGVYSVVAEQEGFETATAVVSLDAGAGVSADLTLASKRALDLTVVAKQLEAAGSSIQPRIGATTYSIPAQAIDNQPGGGENNPLNQVMLQAPGVSQDSFGQIHVRDAEFRLPDLQLHALQQLELSAGRPRRSPVRRHRTKRLPAQLRERFAGGGGLPDCERPYIALGRDHLAGAARRGRRAGAGKPVASVVDIRIPISVR